MRKTALLIAATLSLLLAGCATVGALLGNQLSFTAPQLQSYLERRFPRDYDRLGGLLKLTLRNPRLSIPAGSSRLQVDFDLGVGGLGRETSGHFALQSGLRFDPGSRGLHLDAPAIVRVDIPALGGAMNDNARGLLNRWLVDYAREEPVYRLDDNLLGRIAGRRIGQPRIDGGLVLLPLDQ